MDYFRPYSLSSQDSIAAAWDSQVAAAADIPRLRQVIAERGAEIFPEFARRYAEVRALSRSARRALQRGLARSEELAALPADWRRSLAYSVAGAALLLALAGPAQAGSMTVAAKTPPDINADGKCSLIEAIVNANNGNSLTHPDCPGADGGPNTITLPAGTQTLTYSVASYFGSDTGLPLITSPITIQGNAKAKIVRGKAAPAFRHFAVNATGDLTLNQVGLSGGVANNGGAIFNSYGNVTLNSSIITGNSAHRGGAIENHRGSLALNDHSVLSKNTADYGGAIYNFGVFGYTRAVLHDSLITGNNAIIGGAIFNTGYYAYLFVHDTTFSKNTASEYGGAIYNYAGNAYLYDSLITGNKTGGDGGGVLSKYNKSYLKLDNTTIAKNSANRDGGGIKAINDGYLKLTNSTVTGNKAANDGGGVFIAENYFKSGNSIIKNKAGVAGNDYYVVFH
jgi:hypothetical protein